MHASLSRLPPWAQVLIIIAFCCAANLLLIANPGFFSHDEWQKLDHILKHGSEHYFANYGALKAGPSLSYPVRPIGFIHQGAVAYFMESWPVLVHLIDVLIHAGACLALYAAARVWRAPAPLPLLAALLFALSPLTTLTVGWTAASMDRLYTLFGLAAFAFAGLALGAPARSLRYVLSLGGVFVCGALAVGSKETAIMLAPGLALAGLLATIGPDRRRFDIAGIARRLGPAICAGIPALAYVLIRLPALEASLTGADQGGYAVSGANILQNALAYFAYPFFVTANEHFAGAGSGDLSFRLALAAHLALIVLIALAARPAWALAYVAAYVWPLLPVIAISAFGAHYLYASGAAMALGLAAVLAAAWRNRRLVLGVAGIALVAPLVLHQSGVQRYMYETGRCQASVSTSLRIVAAQNPDLRVFTVAAEPGSSSHILRRYVAGRDRIGRSFDYQITVRDLAAGEAANAGDFRFDRACLVTAPQDAPA